MELPLIGLSVGEKYAYIIFYSPIIKLYVPGNDAAVSLSDASGVDRDFLLSFGDSSADLRT